MFANENEMIGVLFLVGIIITIFFNLNNVISYALGFGIAFMLPLIKLEKVIDYGRKGQENNRPNDNAGLRIDDRQLNDSGG